jgi:hypothetical protein
VDDETRRRRRLEARRRVVRQRRLVAGGILVVLVALLAWGATALLGGGDGKRARAARHVRPPTELPRGGRAILPRYRVVAFYGAPEDAQLGILGIGSPDTAARRLRRQAAPYANGGRAVLPAFELLAAIAQSAPGRQGLYRARQGARVIDRYLAAARRARALLVLDVQPGHADFLPEVKALHHWLVEPDVSLALDPEWHTPGEVPGHSIGSTDAGTVNAVSAYLASIVRRRNLPQKLLLVHQFTPNMIRDRARVVQRRGVAVAFNVDGFGDPPNKRAKYREFTHPRGRLHVGFKLFYHEDTRLLRPRQVLRLRPRPDVIVYE